MSIRKYGRYWAVYDAAGALVCVCLYKKGAADHWPLEAPSGQNAGHRDQRKRSRCPPAPP